LPCRWESNAAKLQTYLSPSTRTATCRKSMVASARGGSENQRVNGISVNIKRLLHPKNHVSQSSKIPSRMTYPSMNTVQFLLFRSAFPTRPSIKQAFRQIKMGIPPQRVHKHLAFALLSRQSTKERRTQVKGVLVKERSGRLLVAWFGLRHRAHSTQRPH